MPRVLNPNVNAIRMEDGTLPSLTSVGAYTLVYVTSDHSVICHRCANGIDQDPDPDAWSTVVDVDVYWEGPDLNCDHCSSIIESSYGDPFQEELEEAV